MLKKILPSAFIVAGLASAAFFVGCTSVTLDSHDNLGAYNSGELQGLYNTHAPVATKATREVIKQLGLEELSATEEKFSAHVVARSDGIDKVEIWISEVNSLQTLMRIRWGAGGDFKKSKQLYDAVEAAFTGTTPAAGATAPAPVAVSEVVH